MNNIMICKKTVLMVYKDAQKPLIKQTTSI